MLLDARSRNDLQNSLRKAFCHRNVQAANFINATMAGKRGRQYTLAQFWRIGVGFERDEMKLRVQAATGNAHERGIDAVRRSARDQTDNELFFFLMKSKQALHVRRAFTVLWQSRGQRTGEIFQKGSFHFLMGYLHRQQRGAKHRLEAWLDDLDALLRSAENFPERRQERLTAAK